MYLSNVGPGSFSAPSSFDTALPGFIPFGTSSKRVSIPIAEDDTPAPGSYDIEGSLLLGSTAGAAKTAFKSKSKRFIPTPVHDGPGSYPLKSTIKNGRPKVFVKPSDSNGLSLLANVLSAAPSIPGKRQSAGYENNENGRLVLASEVNPGFTGEIKDAVGPGDYDPKIIQAKQNPGANMKVGGWVGGWVGRLVVKGK